MFSEQQLEHIKSVARKKKGQGEVSVWQELGDHSDWIGTYEALDVWLPKLKVVQYCAEECKRQHSGEMSVYDMINAWTWAYNMQNSGTPTSLDLKMIEIIGQFVEPIDNKNGFRTIPIGLWDNEIWEEKADWQEVPRLLTTLLESYYEGNLGPQIVDGGKTVAYPPLVSNAADEFYYEYEMIHPFVDGNGRSGKILYNYLLGRLDDPIVPPNFWGGSNP